MERSIPIAARLSVVIRPTERLQVALVSRRRISCAARTTRCSRVPVYRTSAFTTSGTRPRRCSSRQARIRAWWRSGSDTPMPASRCGCTRARRRRCKARRQPRWTACSARKARAHTRIATFAATDDERPVRQKGGPGVFIRDLLCRGPGSNWGHMVLQTIALPTELPRRDPDFTRKLVSKWNGMDDQSAESTRRTEEHCRANLRFRRCPAPLGAGTVSIAPRRRPRRRRRSL